MSSKSSDSNEKESSLPPKRIHVKRRSRSRACASPGRGPLHNGLMTAAWPKTQTYRSPKAGKAANQPWVLKERISHLSDQIEEMEVDNNETSVMLSCGAATEFNVMKTRSHQDAKINVAKEPAYVKKPKENTNERDNIQPTERRVSDPGQVPTASPVANLSRKSASIGSTCSRKTDMNLENRTVITRSSQITKDSKNPPIFIILHTGKIKIGNTCGHATAPVKIYAERIIIQMEEEFTNRNVSLRILCSNLKEVEMELVKRPFFLKVQAKKLHYTNQIKVKAADETDENSFETVTFHLAYENEVPAGIKRDLNILFKERLHHLGVWNESSSPKNVNCPTTVNNNQSSIENKVNTASHIVADEDRSISGCRKRTPLKDTDEQAVPNDPAQDRKLARRILFSDRDDQQERVRSLEHEAAHYQLLLGHKRLEIQRLEERLRTVEQNVVLAREEAYIEINKRDRDIGQLQNEIEVLNLQIRDDKERMKGYRQQIAELTGRLHEKDLAVQEHQQAILVRDNQLKEVRALATSPSKMSEQELREQVRRLENNLRQTRSTLEETRRSKSGISEELRRNVDILGNLREQLRSEVSRSRRFENEAARVIQQVNEEKGSKRAIQVELSDERDRVASLERELLIGRRRIENEINSKVEIEGEIRNLRSTMNEKDATINEIRGERDNAVIEVGILKREIIHLNEQLDSTIRNSGQNSNSTNNERIITTATQPDIESHEWILDRNEIVIQGTVLGVGGWGEVKLGKFRGIDVAVKQIHHLILSPHNRRLFNREMTIASRCRHPCLLQFIGATCDDGIPLFVSEILETDLRSHLRQKALNEREVETVGLDVALALNYLHKQRPLPIIHRDISSSNVLLWYKGNEMHGKLSDYGAANFMRLSMTRHPGASLYSAPETASGEQTTKVDIYSFGVLFCEMSIRELPVQQQRQQQIDLMENQDHRTFVQRCVEDDPAVRPCAEETVDLLNRWKAQKLL